MPNYIPMFYMLIAFWATYTLVYKKNKLIGNLFFLGASVSTLIFYNGYAVFSTILILASIISLVYDFFSDTKANALARNI